MLDIFLLEFHLQTPLTYHYQLIILIFHRSFLNMLAMPDLEQLKSERDQYRIFHDIYLYNFQIHQQVMQYLIEHTGHDTHLSFLC